MISIIITAFREPQVAKAIESIISQEIPKDYELIVACPDEETKKIVERYAGENKNIKHFQDPGKGKSFALNQLFTVAKGDILVFTDGDVYLGENAVQEIIKPFQDPKVGCVGGRVVSQNDKKTMLGYWSHLLADIGAHRMRKKRYRENKFFECSGYLFAIRNHVISEIPLDVAEDAMIPYYFYKKGMKLVYAEDAKVYVKNPTTFKDWVKQRKRTAGAHTKLSHYEPGFPKMKSFRNEVVHGMTAVWSYPISIREYWWTLLLVGARLYMWSALFYDEHFKKKYYNDAWERVETTKGA